MHVQEQERERETKPKAPMCGRHMRQGAAARKMMRYKQIVCDLPKGHFGNHQAHLAAGCLEWWNSRG